MITTEEVIMERIKKYERTRWLTVERRPKIGYIIIQERSKLSLETSYMSSEERGQQAFHDFFLLLKSTS